MIQMYEEKPFRVIRYGNEDEKTLRICTIKIMGDYNQKYQYIASDPL